jgi:hypothetical protein
MNKKELIRKAVAIRTDIVMLCQQIPDQHIADAVERLVPLMDSIIKALDSNG